MRKKRNRVFRVAIEPMKSVAYSVWYPLNKLLEFCMIEYCPNKKNGNENRNKSRSPMICSVLIAETLLFIYLRGNRLPVKNDDKNNIIMAI